MQLQIRTMNQSIIKRLRKRTLIFYFNQKLANLTKLTHLFLKNQLKNALKLSKTHKL